MGSRPPTRVAAAVSRRLSEQTGARGRGGILSKQAWRGLARKSEPRRALRARAVRLAPAHLCVYGDSGRHSQHLLGRLVEQEGWAVLSQKPLSRL